MDGILLVDKPKLYTSYDIVAIVKNITKEKVGHTGTLDPNATGVLPLLIGKATKISKYLINHDKTYMATLKLGIKTNTADGEGEILEKKEVVDINIKDIEIVLQNIIGKQKQIPPMYSAIKINGKKLYEYARKGKQVDVIPRNIEIYNNKLIKYNKEQLEIIFEIECSKGTYIRTICEDIAEKLGTIGYMKELRRTKVGKFDINNSIKIQSLKDNPEILFQKIITIEKFFENYNSITLTGEELTKFLNGMKLFKSNKGGIYKIYSNNIFIGTGVIKDNCLKRDIIQ